MRIKVAECLKNMAGYANRSQEPSRARLRQASSSSDDAKAAEYWRSRYEELNLKYCTLVREKNKLQMESRGKEKLVAAVQNAVEEYRKNTVPSAIDFDSVIKAWKRQLERYVSATYSGSRARLIHSVLYSSC